MCVDFLGSLVWHWFRVHVWTYQSGLITSYVCSVHCSCSRIWYIALMPCIICIFLVILLHWWPYLLWRLICVFSVSVTLLLHCYQFTWPFVYVCMLVHCYVLWHCNLGLDVLCSVLTFMYGFSCILSHCVVHVYFDELCILHGCIFSLHYSCCSCAHLHWCTVSFISLL